ncbi:MAG: hypothetical protein GF333_03200 [Candidatus Omnitrophica bacterium]|nr:hypothetical protein [Candidatus Omnitrophota bacterium]
MKTAIHIWKDSWQLLQRHLKVIVPFGVTALAGVLALWILYLAPQKPVSYLLAPPIRKFLGEKFLHYPYHLFILPKLFYYAERVIIAVVGVLMTGTAIGMIKETFEGKRPRIMRNFTYALRRFFALFVILAVMMGAAILTSEAVKAVFAQRNFATALLMYLAALIPQALFIYALPAIILGRQNVIRAFHEGIKLFGRRSLTTILFIVVPALVYVPVLALNQIGRNLIVNIAPEVILVMIGLGIIASLIIEIWTILAPTVLYLKTKEGSV